MNSTGFLGNLYGVFFNVPPGNKAVGMPNPLMEEESHCVYNCDNAYQNLLNADFLKVCEVCVVNSITSKSFTQWSFIVGTFSHY